MVSRRPLPPPSAAPVATKSDASSAVAAAAEPRMESKFDATAPLDMIKAVRSDRHRVAGYERALANLPASGRTRRAVD